PHAAGVGDAGDLRAVDVVVHHLAIVLAVHAAVAADDLGAHELEVVGADRGGRARAVRRTVDLGLGDGEGEVHALAVGDEAVDLAVDDLDAGRLDLHVTVDELVLDHGVGPGDRARPGVRSQCDVGR